jgi:ubiquinone/menaquinone biosynthesis C-methylase UbiE/uncharacterized protein YbaR (Trm112 family)
MIQTADKILSCPACKSANLAHTANAVTCGDCAATYLVEEGIPSMLSPDSAVAAREMDRMDFWDQGWVKRSAILKGLDREGALRVRGEYETEMIREGYPSTQEVTGENAKDKVLCNIGCGGGYEGLLFAGYGCQYVGIDFSATAVRITRDLTRIAGHEISAYQAEAECLPLQDRTIDIVYTNGVLHHTPNTQKAVEEIKRVLKDGGEAFIGLYATNSLMFFWYRLHAVLRGNLTRDSIQAWLNANTEGEWQTEGRNNKLTETYTRPEFAALLRASGFEKFTFRQTPLQVRHVPIFGKIIRALGLKRLTEVRIGPFGGILMARCTKN